MSDDRRPVYPSRWTQTQSDYCLPVAPPRRPGSDHSHLPRSHERMQKVNEPAENNLPLEERDSRDRPGLVRSLLGDKGLTRSDLVDALAEHANERKTAYNTIYNWLKSGRLVELDGIVHMADPGQNADAAQDMPAPSTPENEERPADEPSPPQQPGFSYFPPRHVQDALEEEKPSAPPQPVEPTPETEAPAPYPEERTERLTVDRLAVTSDGCLIVWFADGRQEELCHRGTAAAHRLLSRNSDLLRSD